MTATELPIVAKPQAADFAPRVVFFGPPYSGKTALLKSFIRLALGPTSEVEAVEPSTGEPTIGRELVPYRVRVDHPDLDPGGVYELIDCDGQAAGELLDHANPFVRGAARGALAETVRSADALVLVIDATATAEVVERTLAEFKRFLENLEEGRTFGREVGGLPIFLTLTKCDALYAVGDVPTDWLSRIEERKRDFQLRFESVFGTTVPDEEPSPFLPFGSIDLQLKATSTSAPRGPAFQPYIDDDGTFGIVGLVADVLPAAKAYRNRVQSAAKRLRWTLTGSGLVLGSMLITGMILLAAGGYDKTDPLTARALAYEANEGPPATRLAEKNFARNQKELLAIRTTSGFDRLPHRLKTLVEDRLTEFDVYNDYRGKFRPPRLGPAEVQTRDQLERLEADLRTPLQPPSTYARSWTDTEAVRLHDKWLADCGLVREAVERLYEWYVNPAAGKPGLIQRGNRLLSTKSPPDVAWRMAVTELLAAAKKPPFQSEEAVPKSNDVPGLRGKKLTYAVAFGFDRNVRASQEWADLARQLRYLVDLTDALGLTSPAGVLVIPETEAPLPLASAILAKLRATYPPPQYPNENYPEWAIGGLPDDLRDHLQNRLATIRETGERHVRKSLRERIGPPGDTAAGWKNVSDALATDPGYAAWGRLLQLDARLADRTAVDPVQRLKAYLAADKIELDLKTLTVTIPDELVDPPIASVGGLVVTIAQGAGQPQEFKYRQDGKPVRAKPNWTYSFVPDGHAGLFNFRPGDKIAAELTARSVQHDYRFVWSAGRSNWYQLDNLGQPPRLEKLGPTPSSDPATGVQLLAPNGALTGPALLPNLR